MLDPGSRSAGNSLQRTIRLSDRGVLPPGYNLGFTDDPTCFDARFCTFWEIDYNDVVQQTRAGGTNEEVLRRCFRNRKWPNDVQILVWNSFLLKRGWRDSGTASLIEAKARYGLGRRDDIVTWVDAHDVDEGRPLRSFE